MSRWQRRLLTLGVVGALLAPVIANHNSFPLSTYPIYSRTRPAEVDIVTARGLGPGGDLVELPMEVQAGTDDPLIAESRLRQAVRSAEASAVMCAEIAARVGPDVTRVELVTESHDVIALVSGDRSTRGSEVHEVCAVAE